MKYKTVKLRSGRQARTRPGHPWIYRSQLLKTDPAIKPGDIVAAIDSEGKFLGTGYYNPHSEISVRILTFIDETIDAGFFGRRIAAAVEKRKGLSAKTNACRMVFSEADGLPGLIVDVYADTAVFQVLTLGMEKFKYIVLALLKEMIRPAYIYEKSDSPFRKPEGMKTIETWHGQTGKKVVEIFEGKAKFLVDIENGHKTGFYLDQRASRMAVGNIAKGKSVLDLFCYTGGFSIHAALSGATSSLGVDIKDDWLRLAGKNATLNGVAGKTEFVRADSFDFIKNISTSGRTFDIIIIDPPSFLKDKRSIVTASKGYKELNELAMKALNEGGILATFSCSHNMPNEVFSGILKEAAAEAGKKTEILKRCHQAQDHPIVRAIPETEYLKGYFLRVSGA